MDQSDLKRRINDTICRITKAKEARNGQVEAVYRLVQEKRDTVLVAATGYGKSAHKKRGEKANLALIAIVCLLVLNSILVGKLYLKLARVYGNNLNFPNVPDSVGSGKRSSPL